MKHNKMQLACRVDTQYQTTEIHTYHQCAQTKSRQPKADTTKEHFVSNGLYAVDSPSAS
mgnify:CR=1 FL=1